MNEEMHNAVTMFYEIYMEFYKKCRDSDTAIRLACAISGIHIPESNTFSFVIGKGDFNGRKRR